MGVVIVDSPASAPLSEHVGHVRDVISDPKMPEVDVFCPIDNVDALIAIVPHAGRVVTRVQPPFTSAERPTDSQLQGVFVGHDHLAPIAIQPEHPVAAGSFPPSPRPTSLRVVGRLDESVEPDFGILAAASGANHAGTMRRAVFADTGRHSAKEHGSTFKTGAVSAVLAGESCSGSESTFPTVELAATICRPGRNHNEWDFAFFTDARYIGGACGCAVTGLAVVDRSSLLYLIGSCEKGSTTARADTGDGTLSGHRRVTSFGVAPGLSHQPRGNLLWELYPR